MFDFYLSKKYSSTKSFFEQALVYQVSILSLSNKALVCQMLLFTLSYKALVYDRHLLPCLLLALFHLEFEFAESLVNLFLIFIRSLFRSSINNPLLISLSGNRDPHFDHILRSKSRKDPISNDRTSKDRILEVQISEVRIRRLKRWTIVYSKEKLPCFIR
jgi:hypothetical protein